MNLTLSNSDHLNAIYTNEAGTPMYQVTAPFSFIGRTATIKKAIPDFDQGTAAVFTADNRYGFLAQVDFHVFASSVLHMQGEEVKTSEFFTRGGFTMRTLGSRKFAGPDGKEYKWILGHSTSSLVVDDGTRTLVAQFHRKHYGIFSKSRPAFLEISALGTHMVDLIMITFVYIEKLRMDKEKARNRARNSGGGGP